MSARKLRRNSECHEYRKCAWCFLAVLAFGCAKNEPEPQQHIASVPKEIHPVRQEKKYSFTQPKHVRGIYLTAWSAGSTAKMKKVAALMKATELNAVVIDIRDAGQIYWRTTIPLAHTAQATPRNAVRRPEVLMKLLEKEGIFPIARIACFKDRFLPKKRKDLAVQTVNGALWKDSSGSTWLDPYNHENWEYIANVVEFALDQGFPEVQLDYVRFPSEGTKVKMVFPAKAKFSQQNAGRTDVISAFASFIAQKVHARGANISADIFGIVSSSKSDQGIGQGLEDIAKPFDTISPMVYPSHYAKGEYGVANPNVSPYAILLKSLRDFSKRLPNKPIRPWLQDFSLGIKYGKAQVQAQIKACKQLGYEEYLLWNPKNVYTQAAVVDNSALIKRAPMKRAQSSAK